MLEGLHGESLFCVRRHPLFFFCFQTSSGGGIENLSLRRVTADKMFCFVSQVCLKRTLFGPSDQNSLESVVRKNRWKLQIKSFVGRKKLARSSFFACLLDLVPAKKKRLAAPEGNRKPLFKFQLEFFFLH